MRLIFLGPPGCGKGTQAKLLGEQQHLEHIATGDILRDAKRRGTPAGNRARSYLEAGQLVPDDLVNDLIAERFSGDDRPRQFIMDGYPRTINQAKTFEQILRQHGLALTGVIRFKVDEEELVRRVAGRLSCPKTSCKATYHIASRPPKVLQAPDAPLGICDLCGTALIQRVDDKEETIRSRLAVFHEQT